jgi:hypothetical protein
MPTILDRVYVQELWNEKQDNNKKRECGGMIRRYGTRQKSVLSYEVRRKRVCSHPHEMFPLSLLLISYKKIISAHMTLYLMCMKPH